MKKPFQPVRLVAGAHTCPSTAHYVHPPEFGFTSPLGLPSLPVPPSPLHPQGHHDSTATKTVTVAETLFAN